MDTHNSFSYDRLPDPKRHIRLLEIVNLDETRDVPVHCRLSTWSIHDAPKYHAISYTWGPADQQRPILINRTLFEVRKNCEYVLKQAKWYHSDDRELSDSQRYIWCDAICIDQTNDAEKADQVSIMSDIYQRAERVLACAGDRSDDIAYLFNRVRANSAFLRIFGFFCLQYKDVQPGSFAAGGLVLRDGLLTRLIVVLWVILQTLLGHKQMFEGVRALAMRDYFKRLWVYQELFLGRDIVLCCGRERVSLKTLYPLVAITLGRVFLAKNTPYWLVVQMAAPIIAAGAMYRLPRQPLRKLLISGKDLECMDQRDKVYGILSMVDWGKDVIPLRPDYSVQKDVFSLAVEITAKLQELALYDPDCTKLAATGTLDDRLFFSALQPIIELAPSELVDKSAQSLRRLDGLGLAVQQRQPEDDQHGKHDSSLEEEMRPRKRELGKGLVLPCVGFQLDKRSDGEWYLLNTASASNVPKLTLPGITEPGDWCLILRIAPKMPSIVLVARSPPEASKKASLAAPKHYSIIGKGCITTPDDGFMRKQWGWSTAGECWEVHFDAEDLVVLFKNGLAWLWYVYVRPNVVGEYVQTRVCRRPQSSVAFRRGCSYTAWRKGAYVQNPRFDLGS